AAVLRSSADGSTRLTTGSRSPPRNMAGVMIRAPAHGAVSAQLRSLLRYQFSAPVKPASVKPSVYTARSPSDSHEGSSAGSAREPVRPFRSHVRLWTAGASPESQ